MTRRLALRFAFAAIVIGSLALTLLLGEFVARLVVRPGDFLSTTMVNDPLLGVRIEPHTTGHDALGFRNAEVPHRVGVVAIGDSMTYGINAPREQAWPKQLSKLMGEPVYNMGLGSYGPLQYVHLSGQIVSPLQPRLLLVGFYFGNDLMDAFSVAHQNPHWQDWRDPSSPTRAHDGRAIQRPGEPRRRFAAVRDWLSRHSVLYAMVRVTLLPAAASWEQRLEVSDASADQYIVWTDPQDASLTTIFTPRLRLSALDQGLPEVQEGLRITKRVFKTIQTNANAAGAKLTIVLIPTKEKVHCRRYHATVGPRLSPVMGKLCDAEQSVKEELVRFLSQEGILYVDVAPALEKHIGRGPLLYPRTSDAHPQAAGYDVIARAIFEALAQAKINEATGSSIR
jgi:lysophospholipase L1-like esterase